MNDPIHSEEYKGYTIDIEVDEYADMNPREECDNLGYMICFHDRYNLGDDHNLSIEEAKEIENSEDVVCLPLYLYDHSGLTMNTTGFHCPWDSGQVGIIYVTKDEIREEFGRQRLSKDIIEKVKNILVSEVKEYDYFLRGECYTFITSIDGDVVDSCGGYLGHENIPEIVKDAKLWIDWNGEDV